MYAAVFAIQLFIGLSLVGLVLGIPSLGPLLEGLLEGESVEVAAGFAVLDAVLLAGFIRYMLKRRGAGWSTLGFRQFSWRKALLYLVVALVVFTLSIGLLITLIDMLVPGFDAEQPQTNAFTEQISTRPLLTLFALVLLPPVIEEMVFRGFIFPGLSMRFGVKAAAVLSSVLFAIAHFQANVGIYTFILGLILCLLYVRFRSIIPGIGLHMVNNLIAYLALGHRAGLQ